MSEGVVPRIVRTRRYVSAPAGAYPAPVAPGRATVEPAPPANAAPDRPAPAEEPPVPLLVGVEETPAAAMATPGPEEPTRPAGGAGWGGLLLGVGVGALVGASLGIVLVAFFGGCEPSLAWTDPLAVWRSVTDPVIRFSGVLVAVGFALLGAALGGRRSPAPPED